MQPIALMADIVGTASAVYALLEAAKELLNHIHYLRRNAAHKLRLQTLAQTLINMLESAETVWPSASALTLQELQSVTNSIQSITSCWPASNGAVNCLLSCVTASSKHSVLEEAERKLESLMTQVLVVEGILQLAHTICNEWVDRPMSDIGLDRSITVMNFLQTSELQELRVIGIHGLPGVGKTTLLNHVWQQVSSKAPFRVRAYVQIGHDTTPYMVGSAQSSILLQLGDKNRAFPSREIGSGRLSKHFQKLRAEKKPLFLALDNVVEAEDLRILLPFNLAGEILPTSTCIVVTCRNFGVVKALLSICRLQEHNQSQVFCFEPLCLAPEESKRVFADCAGMQHEAPEHQELLDALVPMCGGLPLALTVLGRLFVDEARWEKTEWQLVQEQMAILDVDTEDTSAVTKALQLSFERLAESRQEAFLDMVSTFYGWPWVTVERIVGRSVMRDLRNSSLISEVDGIEKCNLSALRKGYYDEYWLGGLLSEKRVAMHDLTLRFGEGILHADALVYSHSKQKLPLEVLSTRGSKLRNLLLSYDNFTPELKMFLLSARNMQMLNVCSGDLKINFVATFGRREPAAERELGYVIIHEPQRSKMFISMKVSSAIRDLTLDKCEDIGQLPVHLQLLNLERLRLSNCPNLHDFQGKMVQEWQNLEDLVLFNCRSLKNIPEELGDLPNLRAFCVGWCDGLQKFPNLWKNKKLWSLMIRYCSLLKSVGDIHCPMLRKLEVEGVPIESLELQNVASLMSLSVAWCENLKKLPTTLANAASLQKLEVIGCNSLTELLPDNIIDNLLFTNSSTELRVADCPNLKALPAGVQNAPDAAPLTPNGKWYNGRL